MYQLSKDYERLYSFIEGGHVPIAFVDYRFRGDILPARDVCKVKRSDDGSINFISRGHGYGGVDVWLVEKYNEEMKTEFIKECQQLNVEWILP